MPLKITEGFMRTSTVAFAAALVCSLIPQTAMPQTMEEMKALCGTPMGRAELVGKLDEMTKYDLKAQAEASGLDPNTHMLKSIEQRCVYLGFSTDVEPTSEQSWTFSLDDIGAPLPGERRILRVPTNPPRCGPVCKGGFTLEFPHPRWQACRLRYKTNYENMGQHFAHDVSGAQLEIKPTSWIDLERFRGFAVNLQAWQHSFIEMSDIDLEIVDANLSAEQLRGMGCLVPANDYAERVGRLECKEERGNGYRDRDGCEVVHSAVGTRRLLRSPMMRKVIISKPVGDTGEEAIMTRSKGFETILTRRLILRPGQRYELLQPPSQTQWRDFQVEITTSKVGQDGKSRYSITLEWYND